MSGTVTSRLLNRLRRTVVEYWSALALGVVLIVAWEVYAQYFNPAGDQYFPSLGYIAGQSMESIDVLAGGLLTTIEGVVLAYALAMVIGVTLGVVFSEVRTIRQLLTPSLIFGYTLPAALLAPLFIIWFGRGISGAAVFAAWMAFFPVFINTMTGMNQVDEDFRYLGELYGATTWQMIRHIKIWIALPHIATSAKVAVQYSILGVIIAEFLGTGTGLGYLIVISAQRAQLGLVYGTVIALIVFAVIFYNLVAAVVDYVTPEFYH